MYGMTAHSDKSWYTHRAPAFALSTYIRSVDSEYGSWRTNKNTNTARLLVPCVK